MAKPVGVLFLRHSSGGGGGADRVVLDVAARLDRSRYRPRIAYLRKPRRDLEPLLRNVRAQGVPYTELEGSRWFDPRQFLALIRLARAHEARVVHCNDPKTDVYGALLRFALPGLRTVSTLHGWTGLSGKGAFYARLDRLAVRSFSAVIAVSRQTARLAAANGIRRVNVVHNGIDVDAWSVDGARRKENSVFTVGFVGRLSAEKGVDTFMATAFRLAEGDGGYGFVVIGEGPEEARARRAAATSGRADRFRFTGFIGVEDLRREYAGMDALLLTSRNEGLPVAVLEACAAGVCVVATDVGGVGEIITHGENGLLAAPGNVEQLAAHVAALRGDPALAERLRSRALNTVRERFSPASCVAGVQDVYASALGEGRAP